MTGTIKQIESGMKIDFGKMSVKFEQRSHERALENRSRANSITSLELEAIEDDDGYSNCSSP